MVIIGVVMWWEWMCRVVVRGLMMVGVCALAGCATENVWREQAPQFRERYRAVEAAPVVAQAVAPVKRLAFKVEGMPLGDLVRYLVDQTGASIVLEESLDQRRVSLECQGLTLAETLDLLAARLGVTSDQRGNQYFLGRPRPDNRGVLVRRVRRLSNTELRESVQAQLSNDGRIACFSDGLMVVSDRNAVLERVGEMLDKVEAADSPVWVVQCFVFSLTDSDLIDLGMDVTPTANVAATFAAGSAGANMGSSSAGVNAGFNAVLRAAGDRERDRVVCEPMFLLSDGVHAKVSQGKRIPVQQSNLGWGGVTSTTYEYVDTGVKLEMARPGTWAEKCSDSSAVGHFGGNGSCGYGSDYCDGTL